MMRRFLRSTLAFTSRHVSSIVAVSSVAIAGASLFLTIEAQKEERDYKELLIRPSLAIRVNTTGFSLGLANDGLGPADVKDIVYQFQGECISMVEPDGMYSQTSYYKVSEALRDRFLTGIFSFAIPGKSTTLVNTYRKA